MSKSTKEKHPTTKKYESDSDKTAYIAMRVLREALGKTSKRAGNTTAKSTQEKEQETAHSGDNETSGDSVPYKSSL